METTNCDICGRPFKGKRGVATHKARTHNKVQHQEPLMDQILRVEKSSLEKMAAIQEQCQIITGRKLSNNYENVVLCLPEYKTTHLKKSVRDFAFLVGKNWDFESPCAFLEWAENLFTIGFEQGRREKNEKGV